MTNQISLNYTVNMLLCRYCKYLLLLLLQELPPPLILVQRAVFALVLSQAGMWG